MAYESFLDSEVDDKYDDIIKFTKAIEIDPQNEYAYYNRGLAKSKLQDDRCACLDWSKAIKINPKFAEAYYNRGVSKNSLGDKRGACLDWIKADELGLPMAPNLIEYCNLIVFLTET